MYVPVLIAINTALIIIVIHHILTREERYMRERLKIVTGGIHESKQFSFGAGLRSILSVFSKIWVAKNAVVRVERKLGQAGIPLKGEEYLTIVTVLAGLGFLLGSLLLRDLLLTGLLVFFAFLLPKLILQSTINKRIKKLDRQIGDALITMANSMRAGFSFLQAMELVSKEMSNPIAHEFGRTLREISLGTSIQDALTNLSERVGSEDLDLVVTAILIQRQVGGNLAEVLDNISITIRERIRLEGEIKTLTAQGRISGWIIGSLPLALAMIIFIIDKNYILTLFREPIGIMALGIGFAGQLIGFIFIKKIIQIEI
ncbi:MAG: type II secretion system F family protein [Bacillota bacterium]